MLNVTTKVIKNKLIIEVDLSQEHGLSKSGKTTIIGSTQGNVSIGHNGAVIGLNVYKPVSGGKN